MSIARDLKRLRDDLDKTVFGCDDCEPAFVDQRFIDRLDAMIAQVWTYGDEEEERAEKKVVRTSRIDRALDRTALNVLRTWAHNLLIPDYGTLDLQALKAAIREREEFCWDHTERTTYAALSKGDILYCDDSDEFLPIVKIADSKTRRKISLGHGERSWRATGRQWTGAFKDTIQVVHP